MTKRGAFITLEGIDGSGKTTMAAVFAQALRARQIDVHTTLEPGGTALGQALRPLLLNSPDLNLTPHAELLLLVAARRQHVEQIIQPKLAAGIWVICDRFSDSSFAYQAARGVDTADIAALHHWALGDFTPDLTLLLDLPVEQAAQRAVSTSSLSIEGNLDNDAKLGFQQQVRHHYQRLAQISAGRMQILAADDTMEAVHQAALEQLDAFCQRFEHA